MGSERSRYLTQSNHVPLNPVPWLHCVNSEELKLLPLRRDMSNSLPSQKRKKKKPKQNRNCLSNKHMRRPRDLETGFLKKPKVISGSKTGDRSVLMGREQERQFLGATSCAQRKSRRPTGGANKLKLGKVEGLGRQRGQGGPFPTGQYHSRYWADSDGISDPPKKR